MRVLIALPSSVELKMSSSDMIAGALRPLSSEKIDVPPWLRLDPTYAPVAIGEVGHPDQQASALLASESKDFLVRSEIDENQLQDVQDHFGQERVFSDPDIETFVVCPGDAAVGATTDVETKLGVATLNAHQLTGHRSAIAIMDTGINRAHLISCGLGVNVDPTVYWKRPTGATPGPGLHAVSHGTMCAYDALISASRATLLDYPILGPAPLSSSAIGGALSNALSAYAHLLSWWAVAFGRNRSNYDSLVVSNSWGMYHPSRDFSEEHPGRYLDNMNHPFNQIVSVLSSCNVDILFAAGNCGSHCPSTRCTGNTNQSITGANAHPDVVCIGGVDTQDNWAGYSSEGPAVPEMDREKPDIVAYTHFDGSRKIAGTPDSGTSAACPVAAGCVAALRSVIGQAARSPGDMAATLEATARKPGGAVGWDPQFGHGIIDPVAAGKSLRAIS